MLLLFLMMGENRVVYDWFLIADKLHRKSREACEKGLTSRRPSSSRSLGERTSHPSTIPA
jgi:hypothetical protein